MRTNGWMFAVFGVFFVGTDIVYWYASGDPTGTACLGISAGLGFMISGYLLFTDRRIGLMPQDRPDAEISDGAGEMGHFVAASWWPIVIAFSVGLTLLGLIFAMWLTLIGAVLVITGVSGLVFENLTLDEPRPTPPSALTPHH